MLVDTFKPASPEDDNNEEEMEEDNARDGLPNVPPEVQVRMEWNVFTRKLL